MSGRTSLDAGARPWALLLTGIGLTAAVALRAVPSLEAHFRVISGLGVTTAEDAVVLLDAAGVEHAHIVGLSFGGAIAQEIAIRHPERVRSLVLGSSTAGGKLYAAPERRIRQFVRRLADLPAEEGLWATVPYLYVETTYQRHASLIGEDIARRLSSPLDPRSYRAQHSIARGHDTSTRLAAITAPTLVMHGEDDRILPLENGRLLTGAIPGAQFIALENGGHAFPTDVPGASRELVSFLLAHSPARARPATQSRAAARNARAGRA